MLNKNVNLPGLVWVAALALVAACGGGGGGDATPAPGPSVALSAQNEATLSAAATQEIGLGQDVAGIGVALAPSANAVIASTPLKRAVVAVAKSHKVNTLAATVLPCSGGGSFTIDVASPTSVRLTFDNCVEDGETANGSMSLTLVSNPADLLKLVFDATLNLTVTQGNATEKLSGDLRLSIDASTAGQVTVVFSSTSQSFQRSANGQLLSSRTLRGYQWTSVVADSGQQVDSFAFNSEGSLNLLGSAAYRAETLTALTTLAGATDPSSGQIKITVGGKGIILLTVEPGRVHVQADVEGDGSFEVDRFQAWSSLDGIS